MTDTSLAVSVQAMKTDDDGDIRGEFIWQHEESRLTDQEICQCGRRIAGEIAAIARFRPAVGFIETVVPKARSMLVRPGASARPAAQVIMRPCRGKAQSL
ncbi:hypothetical protein ASD31_04040 [Rhizobium sp. Root482]|nr:hypothetical protein ASD31_04040 [Rhizobium sp. Root482]